MSHTKPWVLVILVMLTGIGTVFVLNLRYLRGASLPADGYAFTVLSVIISVIGIWLGLQVQRLKKRKETWITAVGAARVAALSLAMSHTGAIFLGYFGAQLVFLVSNHSNEALVGMVWQKVIAGLGAVIMVITGLLIEKICSIDPEDPESQSHPGSAPEPA